MPETNKEIKESPDRIYLLGAGRNPLTRNLRRSARFSRRSFRIGGIPIRPGLRVPVNLEFVEKYRSAVVEHVNAGTLIVQYSSDSFVTADELDTILAAYKAERKPRGDDEEEADETDLDENSEEQDSTEPEEQDSINVDQSAVPSPDAEQAPDGTEQPTNEAVDESEHVEPEHADEGGTDNGVLSSDVDDSAVSLDPPESPAEEEPAADVEELSSDETDEVDETASDLSTLTKKELLAKCKDAGIEVEKKTSNAKLIELLTKE